MKRSVERCVPGKSENMITEYLCPVRWPKLLAIIFMTVLALCITNALAQDTETKDLEEFYQQNCARCHGADGSAIDSEGRKLKGPSFLDKDWQQNTEDDEMVKAILKGKFFGLAMPKFKDALTEEEARWIVTNIIRNSRKGLIIAPESDK